MHYPFLAAAAVVAPLLWGPRPVDVLPAAPGAGSGDAAEVRTYLRGPDELWVYEAGAELGMNAHLHSFELYGRNFDQMRAIGTRFVRHTLKWQEAEEARRPDGSYVHDPRRDLHTYFDNFAGHVRRAQERGMEIVAVVHGMPNLPPDVLARIDDREHFDRRFARFVGEMAREFPEIRFWQLWNEPDAGHWGRPFGAWQGGDRGFDRRAQGRAYARFLEAAAAAIRAESPDAWIVTGGFAGTEGFRPDGSVDPAVSWEFLRGMYEAGGARHFDILAVHAYGERVVPNGPGGDTGEVARSMRAALGEVGDPDRPLWLTEFGAGAADHVADHGLPHTRGQADGSTFDEAQRAWWERALSAMRAGGEYAAVFGYALYSPVQGAPATARLPRGRVAEDYGLGLFRMDGVTPRPTYRWLVDARPNRGIVPRRTDVEVSLPAGKVPEGYEYRNGVIRGVPVDGPVPTVIRLRAG